MIQPRVIGEGPLALTIADADDAERECSGFVPGEDKPCLNLPILTITGQGQTWHFCGYHSRILGVLG